MAEQSRTARSWLLSVGVAIAPLSLVFYAIEQRSFLAGHTDRGQVFARDFINYWTGARLLLAGKVDSLFVQADYAAALARIWGGRVTLHSFSYPPNLFPFIAWTGLFSYSVAAGLWIAVGVVGLLAAAWPYSRNPVVALIILLSPAVVVCIDDGQNGLITAALIVGGLRLVDRRPWLAGALIGLATFKPQLGLLIPLALIAAGRWKAVGGAALSALLLAGVSLWIAGVDGWRLYLTEAAPFQRFLTENSTGMFQTMMPTPFMAARLIGLPLPVSYALQALAGLACAILIVLRFRRLALERRAIAPMDILVLVVAGMIASPYAFNYDMPGVVLALILADRVQPSLSLSPPWRWAVATLWSAPILMMLLPVVLEVWNLPVLPVGTAMAVLGLGLLLATRPAARTATAPAS